MIYENEADSMLVACLQGGEIPKEIFNVPGDDDDEHEDLDDVEKWEIAKNWCPQKTGNISGIYVSADGKIESELAETLRKNCWRTLPTHFFATNLFGSTRNGLGLFTNH
jgi:hypothetical protein